MKTLGELYEIFSATEDNARPYSSAQVCEIIDEINEVEQREAQLVHDIANCVNGISTDGLNSRATLENWHDRAVRTLLVMHPFKDLIEKEESGWVVFSRQELPEQLQVWAAEDKFGKWFGHTPVLYVEDDSECADAVAFFNGNAYTIAALAEAEAEE